MMHKSSSLLAVGFAIGLALAWACGPTAGAPSDGGPIPVGDGGTDAGTPKDGGTTAGIPLDAACGQINAARCAFLQRCGLLPLGQDTSRECEDSFSATDCGPARWPSRVKKGTLSYDGAKAQACVDAWGARACVDYRGAPQACAEVTHPAAPLDAECLGGLRTECIQGSCTGGTCPRHCRLAASAGGICEVDADCKPGLYCLPNQNTGAGTCTAFSVDGEPCDARRLCAQGYSCGEGGTCHLANKIGEACAPGTCESAGFCAWNSDGGTCLARRTQSQPCADDGQCRSDLLCRTEDGVCAPRVGVALGQPCSRRQLCVDGLACVGTQVDPFKPPELGACATPVAPGGACTSSFDCVAPLACVDGPDGGTCTTRQPDGAKCTGDLDCQAFSRCQNATCTPIPAKGEVCPGGACLWGACGVVPDAGTTDPLCKGFASGNQPCGSDVECSSLRCVSGTCLVACTP